VGNLGECCWDRSFNYPVGYVHKYRVCDLFLALSDTYTEVREISVMYPWMLNTEHPVCYRIVAHGPYHNTDSLYSIQAQYRLHADVFICLF